MTSDLCLVSGGVDSTIMAMQYPQATRVFIDFGQPYAEREKKALNGLFGSTYQTITVRNKLDKESELSDIFIPSRNLFLASLVVVKFKPDRVLIAGLGDDYVVDKNPDAFEHMSEILTRFSGKPITVYSPFFGFTKGSLVESFLESSSDKNEARITLEKTYSCYSGEEKPCMDCPACFRKFVALASNGIFNKQSIPSDRIIKEYLQKLHTYNPERI